MWRYVPRVSNILRNLFPIPAARQEDWPGSHTMELVASPCPAGRGGGGGEREGTSKGGKGREGEREGGKGEREGEERGRGPEREGGVEKGRGERRLDSV